MALSEEDKARLKTVGETVGAALITKYGPTIFAAGGAQAAAALTAAGVSAAAAASVAAAIPVVGWGVAFIIGVEQFGEWIGLWDWLTPDNDSDEIASWCEDNPQFTQYFGYASGYTYVNCKDYTYRRQEGHPGEFFDEVGNAVQGWLDQFASPPPPPPLPKSSAAGAGAWLVDQQAKDRADYLADVKARGVALAFTLAKRAEDAKPKLSVQSSGAGKAVAVVGCASILGALAWFMLRRSL